MEVLKVSANSHARAVAGAIDAAIKEDGKAEIHAIGVGAVNQTVKAVAIAREFAAPSGLDLVCIPAFIDILIEREECTVIRIIVEPR